MEDSEFSDVDIQMEKFKIRQQKKLNKDLKEYDQILSKG